MVEFHKRFDRHNIILKDLFESGKLGAPLYSVVEYSQKKSIPTKSPTLTTLSPEE